MHSNHENIDRDCCCCFRFINSPFFPRSCRIHCGRYNDSYGCELAKQVSVEVSGGLLLYPWMILGWLLPTLPIVLSLVFLHNVSQTAVYHTVTHTESELGTMIFTLHLVFIHIFLIIIYFSTFFGDKSKIFLP